MARAILFAAAVIALFVLQVLPSADGGLLLHPQVLIALLAVALLGAVLFRPIRPAVVAVGLLSQAPSAPASRCCARPVRAGALATRVGPVTASCRSMVETSWLPHQRPASVGALMCVPRLCKHACTTPSVLPLAALESLERLRCPAAQRKNPPRAAWAGFFMAVRSRGQAG
ncbi:MAG: hypothetical protein Q8O29_02510 [Polaromonas sp.]|uniref:hypothetical protein n=1 Tax=Polaromonas sp. TaxID=1869339 RepID=UPI002734945A|nr:hypothetical protein [Polaromonas sp.]MDP2817148.1 hypothetical protein [Polaromonas sp.]